MPLLLLIAFSLAGLVFLALAGLSDAGADHHPEPEPMLTIDHRPVETWRMEKGSIAPTR